MKSIKPGRGPSMMNAIGAAVAVVFGIIWTIVTINMGAPFFFALFGFLFVGLGIVQLVYHLKNATGENRYSAFDITEQGEEPDPLQQRIRPQQFQSTDKRAAEQSNASRFCPYCGTPAVGEYSFCPKCGKPLPRL